MYFQDVIIRFNLIMIGEFSKLVWIKHRTKYMNFPFKISPGLDLGLVQSQKNFFMAKCLFVPKDKPWRVHILICLSIQNKDHPTKLITKFK